MSPQSGLTIGELASRTGCTAEAIRYYEREGVVPKSVRRGNGRYRVYNEADVERLAFLHRARELGFSLAEVRELITLADGDPNYSCSTVDAIAKAHLVQVESKLQQLSGLRDELLRIIRACEGGLSVSDCRILGALTERDELVQLEGDADVPAD
ncbi:MAG: helix-turn-helix domain-containing protein [Gemmatimonadaceae bacterium]